MDTMVEYNGKQALQVVRDSRKSTQKKVILNSNVAVLVISKPTLHLWGPIGTGVLLLRTGVLLLRAALHYGGEVHWLVKNFSPRHGYLRQGMVCRRRCKDNKKMP
jgi:hypothetical protein